MEILTLVILTKEASLQSMCINLTEEQTQQHTDNSTKQQNETGKDPVAGLQAHSGGIVKYNSIHLNLILM